MSMPRPMADMLATPIASYINHHAPHLGLNRAIIAAEMVKAPTEHPVTMQAAWKLAGDLVAGRGQYRTFAALAEVATGLAISSYLPDPTPAPVPQAPYRPYQQGSSHQPVNPRLEPECPTHPGQRAANCGGCRADMLAAA